MNTVNDDPVVIVAAARTPMGGLQGELAGLAAPQLGSAVLAACLARAGWGEREVDQVLMGCVLPAGLGQAPARQAALGAGLAKGTPCTTLNKMCGSGMQAAILGHDQLLAGSARVVLAGGMESMSNAPYLLARARAGYRMGHGQVIDHMFLDGLEDAYAKGRLMGTFAEDCAARLSIGREQQDAFAIASLTRAQQAISEGLFREEIVPLSATVGKHTQEVRDDEQPPKARLEKIPTLKPAFRDGGTVTAANSSSISDGAAALLLMRASHARAEGLAPLAIIRGHSVHAGEPGEFPLAPIGAIEKLMAHLPWQLQEVDLFEINEAFAVVTLAAIQVLGLAPDKVNVNGGACALGHPIGASGARILVTLLHALRQRGLRRGVAAICIGGGEATAMALEIPDTSFNP
ncbi:acetyl-CoA C-acyltransferase [Pseudomonas sp. NPDC007930]|uniref:acetyl-CoA C-acyltransferase n=1 Tax=Pseudomonas sp. NPDC007930 TaxID=3364417 RepID=UPI0036F054CD